MEHDLDRLIEIKASILSHGINFDMQLFRRLSNSYYDNQFVYGKTSKNVTGRHRFPQALCLGDSVISACLRREGSPWRINSTEDGDIELACNGEKVMPITLPERPPYFSRILSDGTPADAVIAVAGEDTPGFFFYPSCYYFSRQAECTFCGMKTTRAGVGKHLVFSFPDERVAEATRLIQETPWRPLRLISISTGTCRRDQDIVKHILKPLAALHGALKQKVPIHLLTHPPQDFALIKAFQDVGVTTIAFNLEVFDPDRFSIFCPGKAKNYGYKRWLESLDFARDVFGKFNAYCGLVWGLEPVDSVVKGYEFFLQNGIGIASNVFHADPGCRLHDFPHPSVVDIMTIAYAQTELYRQYQEARTIFSVSMRSTLDWEIHRRAST